CEDRAGTTGEQDGGGFARYVAVDAGRLVRLPEGLSPRTAALAEPLAVALHAVTRAELSPGDTVMVFGAGPIGALAVAALVADGRYPVTVVEPNEGRRQLALGIGAVAAVDPEVLERYEPWEPERSSPHAVDAVLECSGKRAAIETAVHQLRRGGRLVLVGVGMEQPRFDPNRLLLNELEIRGAFVYDADGFERALNLLASGAIPVAQLVEPDVPLHRLPEALADLAAGKIAGKVMVVPRPGPEAVSG
ncbi:MAG: zinc-dependent alcohol dehydrogenase, partial [Acidimicrobiales bacterium]